MAKFVYDGLKSFNEDAKCSDERLLAIKSDIEMVYSRHRDEINKEYGQVGGGMNSLELYCQTGGGKSPLKKSKHTVCVKKPRKRSRTK